MAIDLALELQYTPGATAPPDLRATVASAFRTAGLAVARVTTAAGTEGPPPPGLHWAPPQLEVRLCVSATNGETRDVERQTVARVQLHLIEALGTLRRMRPELPVSLAVVTPARRTCYAFRHDDTADDVAAGVAALVTGCTHNQARVHGWDRTARCWIPL
jgi:hypothetical protein